MGHAPRGQTGIEIPDGDHTWLELLEPLLPKPFVRLQLDETPVKASCVVNLASIRGGIRRSGQQGGVTLTITGLKLIEDAVDRLVDVQPGGDRLRIVGFRQQFGRPGDVAGQDECRPEPGPGIADQRSDRNTSDSQVAT